MEACGGCSRKVPGKALQKLPEQVADKVQGCSGKVPKKVQEGSAEGRSRYRDRYRRFRHVPDKV